MQVCPASLCSRRSPKILSQSIEFLPIESESNITEFEEKLKQICYDSVKSYMQNAKHGAWHAVGTQQMIAIIKIILVSNSGA